MSEEKQITKKEVMEYFVSVISDLKETDLEIKFENEEIILKPTRWLDFWDEIMDYVSNMDGEWVKSGKNGYWVISMDNVETILDELFYVRNHDNLMWFTELSDSERTRLVPIYDNREEWRKLSKKDKLELIVKAKEVSDE